MYKKGHTFNNMDISDTIRCSPSEVLGASLLALKNILQDDPGFFVGPGKIIYVAGKYYRIATALREGNCYYVYITDQNGMVLFSSDFIFSFFNSLDNFFHMGVDFNSDTATRHVINKVDFNNYQSLRFSADTTVFRRAYMIDNKFLHYCDDARAYLHAVLTRESFIKFLYKEFPHLTHLGGFTYDGDYEHLN